MSFDVGDEPTVGVVNATANGSTNDDIYVGATTPNNRTDPNIDFVDVVFGSNSAQIVIYPAEGLAPGTYTGTLVMQACRDEYCNRHHPGSPHNVAYTITVRPNFQVSPTPIALQGDGGLGASQAVNVTLPPGVTSYTVTPQDSWATIDQQTSTGFRVTAAPRAIGTYQTTLTLRSGNYSRTVPVTYAALPRQLRLSVPRVDFATTSGDPAQLDIAVQQLAEGQTSYTTSSNQPWLSVANETSGGFRVQALSLPSGTYNGTVTVTSGYQALQLPVTYVVTAPPGGDRPLSIARTSLAFVTSEGTSAAPQLLGLQRPSWNAAVDLSYAPPRAAWLNAQVLPNGDIEVSASAVGLAAGHYASQITLTPAYPGTPVTIPVALTVGNGLATPPAQRIVLNNDSTTASLQGTVPVRSNGPTSVQWSATSSAPWLRITQASGTLGQDVAFEIDLQAALLLPDYTDQPATVSISAAGYTSVSTSVTLRRELAEVYYVGPGNLTAGRAAQVFVRGRGFNGMTDPAARLSIAGATPTSVTRLSDSSLSVQLPALAAGSYEIRMTGLGNVSSTATLRVLDEQTFPAATVPMSGRAYSTVYDPVARTVYSANTTLSAVRRTRYQGGTWVTDSLPLPALRDIGLSPDGTQLIAIESTGQLHLISTSSFTITQTYTMPGPAIETPSGNRGLAVTNDGKVWLSIGSYWFDAYTFDLRSRTFTRVRSTVGQELFHFGPWFEVSRNGERLVMASTASLSPAPPLQYMNASEGIFRNVPGSMTFFYRSQNGMGDSADRFIHFARTVYDANYLRVGDVTIPDAGWFASAAVLSPDGRKVYVYAMRSSDWNNPYSPTLPRLYVFDSSIAPGTQVDLPLLGSFELPAYPNCRSDAYGLECVGPNITASPDGRTLFIVGSVGMEVIPLSNTYAGLAARRTGAQVMKSWKNRAAAK